MSSLFLTKPQLKFNLLINFINPIKLLFILLKILEPNYDLFLVGVIAIAFFELRSLKNY